MASIRDWDEWKNTLGNAVNLGEAVGVSDHGIKNIAEVVGTFLSKAVDPKNKEERLLKEMWDVADTKDRDVLAKLVVKMVDK